MVTMLLETEAGNIVGRLGRGLNIPCPMKVRALEVAELALIVMSASYV